MLKNTILATLALGFSATAPLEEKVGDAKIQVEYYAQCAKIITSHIKDNGLKQDGVYSLQYDGGVLTYREAQKIEGKIVPSLLTISVDGVTYLDLHCDGMNTEKDANGKLYDKVIPETEGFGRPLDIYAYLSEEFTEK